MHTTRIYFIEAIFKSPELLAFQIAEETKTWPMKQKTWPMLEFNVL